MFEIAPPPSVEVSHSSDGMLIKGEFKFEPGFSGKMTSKFVKAQEFIDSEVLRLCSPLVPFRNGALEGSGQANTRIGSGEVIYKTPYARRWYYEPANFNGAPQRGNKWFERMKQQSGQTILQGAMKILHD